MQVTSRFLLELELKSLAGKAYTNKHGQIVNYAKPNRESNLTKLMPDGQAVFMHVSNFGIVLEYVKKDKDVYRTYSTNRGLLKALANLGYPPAVSISRRDTIDKVMKDLE